MRTSASALSRLENGEIPDLQTFLVLGAWIGWSVAALFHQDREPDTVQLVEEALRNDGVLAPEIIAAFFVLLRTVRGAKGD